MLDFTNRIDGLCVLQGTSTNRGYGSLWVGALGLPAAEEAALSAIAVSDVAEVASQAAIEVEAGNEAATGARAGGKHVLGRCKAAPCPLYTRSSACLAGEPQHAASWRQWQGGGRAQCLRMRRAADVGGGGPGNGVGGSREGRGGLLGPAGPGRPIGAAGPSAPAACEAPPGVKRCEARGAGQGDGVVTY